MRDAEVAIEHGKIGDGALRNHTHVLQPECSRRRGPTDRRRVDNARAHHVHQLRKRLIHRQDAARDGPVVQRRDVADGNPASADRRLRAARHT